MIWTTEQLLLEVYDIQILPRLISDHNPILMRFKKKSNTTFCWRLNEELLSVREILQQAEKESENFFKINDTGEISMLTVWDAYKATMRGFWISQNKREKVKKQTKEKGIQKQISEVEVALKRRPGKKVLERKLKLLKQQLESVYSADILKQLKSAKQKYFEWANKPGKLLAWKLKRRKERTLIKKIVEDQKEHTDQKTIEHAFLSFYSTLYKEKGKLGKEKIKEYLEKTDLPVLSEDEQEMLDSPITIQEIEQAISRAKTGSAPGLDGFPARHYKELKSVLIEPLKKLFNQILESAEIPKSWNQASITLIPKEDQDITSVRSYRPISLLGNDYKLFVSVMAERLKKVLQRIIHEDQAGFLPGRQIKDNIRVILDVLEYHEIHQEKELALIFLDAEKAFDNVRWDFLKTVMDHVGIGPRFKNVIDGIYTQQKAKLAINGALTKEFPITKGTRQGCPLSPLLFILVMEVLLQKFRNNKEIKGLKIGESVYKVRAYADDVVLILQDPENSLKEAVEVLNEFGNFAGMKVNYQKTKILCKNMPLKSQKELERISGCRVVKKLRYLGIQMTAKNIDLIQNNYQSVWKEIERDLITWNRLNLSLMGRIATLKMNVLPKMLFLFQALPILRDNKCFDAWQKHLSKFVWAGRKPRIKMKILQDAKERGGLGMPNLRLYYEACCLDWIRPWLKLDNQRLLDLEGFDKKLGWHTYLITNKVDKMFTHHYVRSSLLKVWNKYKAESGGTIPLWVAPWEILEKKTFSGGKEWIPYSELLTREQDAFKLRSAEEIGGGYTWLQFQRIKHLFESHRRERGISSTLSDLDDILCNAKQKVISQIYKQLLLWYTREEIVKSQMIQWARNVNKTIYLAQWEKVWRDISKMSYSVNLRENCYKMLYRWYMSPELVSKMQPGASSKCWKCKSEEGTFYHMWWTCEKAKKFWAKVIEAMIEIIQQNVLKKPELLLLGIGLECFPKNDQRLMWNMITAARMTYAQHWKSDYQPTLEDWLEKLWAIAEMDKMTMKLREFSDDEFDQVWKKLVEYINIKFRINLRSKKNTYNFTFSWL